LALGLSEKNVLFVVYALCLIFGATAVLCTNAQQKFFVLIGLLILMLLIVSGIVVFSRRLSKK
jgi:Na+/proline symporter